MRFKEVGRVGFDIIVKVGVVGARRIITLTRRRTGEHILSLNKTAAMELVTLLRAGIREIDRVELEVPLAKVKPVKR